MSGRPEELERLDTIIAGVDIAHEVIFDMYRELLERDQAQTESAKLVAESAQIAVVQLPRLVAPLRRLATRWDEESLLDPAAADRTAEQIAAELAVVEPELRSLVARQREIGAILRVRLGP